jgi:hypothetical protein
MPAGRRPDGRGRLIKLLHSSSQIIIPSVPDLLLRLLLAINGADLMKAGSLSSCTLIDSDLFFRLLLPAFYGGGALT